MRNTLQAPADKPMNAVRKLTDGAKARAIVKNIRDAETALRTKHGWLRHQDAIGASFLVFAMAGMLSSGVGYYYGVIPAWICICVAAFFASLAHEIEHDLIHRLYFRNQPIIHNLMMAVVWLMRPNTVNPWYRRKIHLLHHRESGSVEDLEERLVGNGQRYSLTRFIVMFDGMAGLLLRARKLGTAREFSLVKVLSSAFPLTTLYFTTWYAFLAFHAVDMLAAAAGTPIAWAPSVAETMLVVDFAVVVLVAPNVLRSFCLNFVTSSMHYYGGVDGLMQQTQVFTPWFLAPMQLFCFNFGSTHTIHHFVASQPFYIRQMVAGKAHETLRRHGIRHNDLSTFLNGNRYVPA